MVLDIHCFDFDVVYLFVWLAGLEYDLFCAFVKS